MELDEFHIDQVCPGVVGKRLAIASVFPRVTRDFVSATNATGRHDNGLGLEQDELAMLSRERKGSGNAITLFQ
jgi:hypothetical protein